MKIVTVNHKKTLYASAIIAIFALSTISSVAQPSWKTTTLTQEDSGPTIVMAVKDAKYGDFDNDGHQDDTLARVEMNLTGANRFNFEYWVTLTLPSGRQFVFGWNINTRLNFLNLTATMYNTAIEAGMYHLHVEIVLKTGGATYLDVEHVFDPPGGQTNTPPGEADLSY